MKKIALLLGVVAMVAFSSCKKETTTEEVVVPAETVDTMPPPPPPPAPDTVVVKTTETDGTSVNVNSDGVDIKSSNGDKKTSVEVKK